MRQIVLSFIFTCCFAFVSFAQHDHNGHNHDHNGHDHSTHQHDDGHQHGEKTGHDADAHKGGHSCCGHDTTHEFNAGDNAIHHISDANVYSIGPFSIPLPCIMYVPGEGFKFFSSSVFELGHKAHEGFVIDGGTVKRVTDSSFPREDVPVCISHKGKDAFVCYNNKLYATDNKSTADGGLFGGGITSYYDFSLTKNVVSMLIVCLFLAWLFISVAKAYTTRAGKGPTGKQNLMETFIVFIQDEVAKPFLGHKYRKYLPFLLTIFFFILGLNLYGQVPFFGGSNVTGNLAVTAVLAIITFLVTNISGNADYWKHQLLAPGTPWFVKPILIPVEILGLFIKPVTLMLRLFANITAGHMVILIFVSFIFIFGKSGESIPGAAGGVVGATLLTLFMMTIELIVAFVQAFVFTILTASYIGAATEEHDHH